MPVDSGKRVENPEGVEGPCWALIERLQPLDSCPCLRDNGRQLLAGDAGEQIGASPCEPVSVIWLRTSESLSNGFQKRGQESPLPKSSDAMRDLRKGARVRPAQQHPKK